VQGVGDGREQRVAQRPDGIGTLGAHDAAVGGHLYDQRGDVASRVPTSHRRVEVYAVVLLEVGAQLVLVDAKLGDERR